MTSYNLTSILSAVIRFTSEIYTGIECRSPCWATHVGSACVKLSNIFWLRYYILCCDTISYVYITIVCICLIDSPLPFYSFYSKNL